MFKPNRFQRWNNVHLYPTELEHSVNITASSTSPAALAGGTLTLNCTAVSSRTPNVTWTGPNGPAVDENGITLSEQTNDGLMASVLLTIDPLQTSHAGYYTCVSNIEDGVSEKQAQYLVIVKSKSCISIS